MLNILYLFLICFFLLPSMCGLIAEVIPDNISHHNSIKNQETSGDNDPNNILQCLGWHVHRSFLFPLLLEERSFILNSKQAYSQRTNWFEEWCGLPSGGWPFLGFLHQGVRSGRLQIYFHTESQQKWGSVDLSEERFFRYRKLKGYQFRWSSSTCFQ